MAADKEDLTLLLQIRKHLEHDLFGDLIDPCEGLIEQENISLLG